MVGFWEGHFLPVYVSEYTWAKGSAYLPSLIKSLFFNLHKQLEQV